MRILPLLLVAACLSACTSTRVVDATWDGPTLAALNQAARVDTVVTTNGAVFRRPGHASAAPGGLSIGVGAPTDHRVVPEEIRRIAVSRINRGKGFRAGATGGFLLGAVLGAATVPPCSEQGLVCIGPGHAAIGLGLVGSVFGGLFGVMAGSRETTIYRFGAHGAVAAGPTGVTFHLERRHRLAAGPLGVSWRIRLGG